MESSASRPTDLHARGPGALVLRALVLAGEAGVLGWGRALLLRLCDRRSWQRPDAGFQARGRPAEVAHPHLRLRQVDVVQRQGGETEPRHDDGRRVPKRKETTEYAC